MHRGDAASDWESLPEWLVLFSDSPPVGFRRFLKAGFRHVRALAFDAMFDTWIMYDAQLDQLVVRPIDRATVTSLLSFTHWSGGKVLRAAARKRRLSWRPPSCAAAVGELLGVSALTPFGLHRTLLANGATELKQHGLSQATEA